MRNRRIGLLLTICSLLFVMSFTLLQRSFKDDQKRYPRVRTAYSEKSGLINVELKAKSLKLDQIEIYLRVFKFEKELELWGRSKGDEKFKKIKTYEVCATSGKLGPKRKQGDLQIPEGFYHINRFNPNSNFYLSLGINYPNKSDRILGVKSSLGGDIFIHGNCVTIGCVPITNALIKELYVYCVEAKNNGQSTIPVTIFPAHLNRAKYNVLLEKFQDDSDKINLWKSLRKGYDLFNKSKKLPSIAFLETGRYSVN
jgi:murein L,D-transpeptidase YafK